MSKTIRIGTRASDLAMWQANRAHELLEKALPDASLEIVKISTMGDRDKSTELSSLGTQGVFVKELEARLLANEIDIAVHSSKDMPSQLDHRLVIGAVLPRGKVEDVLVSRNGQRLSQLRKKAIIGTSSPRRKSQLLRLRPDLDIRVIRGNVPTRIKKIEEQEYDATILAHAGVTRLGLEKYISEVLPMDYFLPAPGQGIVSLQCRKDDADLVNILRSAGDEKAFSQLEVERGFQIALQAGCHSAIAGYASFPVSDWLHFKGRVLSLDGKTLLEDEDDLQAIESPRDLGSRIAEKLIQRGASELIVHD